MGARCRLSVDVGYVGVEGERDVIDKQGAALVRLLDRIQKCGGQPVHDQVLQSQAIVETGGSPQATIEGQFVQRRLRNVKAENVERRVELGNWVAAKREQKSRARWRRRAQDFLPFHPHIDSYGPQYNVESKGRFVGNVLRPKTAGSFAPEPREGNGRYGRRTRQHCRSASEAKPIADDGAVIAARHNSCLRSPVRMSHSRLDSST